MNYVEYARVKKALLAEYCKKTKAILNDPEYCQKQKVLQDEYVEEVNAIRAGGLEVVTCDDFIEMLMDIHRIYMAKIELSPDAAARAAILDEWSEVLNSGILL